MRDVGVIYCIQNKVNGKLYIGQTVQPSTRKRQHFTTKKGPHCLGLFRAMNKHGRDNFTWSILEKEVPKEMLNDLERHFIWQYQSVSPRGYNFTGGGDGFDDVAFRVRSANPNWQRMMDQRNKSMAKDPKWIARNKEQSIDPVWKANHAEGLKRRAMNPEWRAKVGKGPNGGKKTSENIANLTAANRKKAKDPEWLKRNYEGCLKRSKKVVCVETGIAYVSCVDAEKDTGISNIMIGQCAKGKYKRAGGYHWRYATEEESKSARRVV